MTTLSVGGMTFDGGPTPGVDVLEKLGGWYDGTDLTGDVAQRPQKHGTFGSPAWHGGRTVTAVVSRRCTSDAEAGAARRLFAAMLAGGQYEDLTVVEPDGHVTSARVRLASGPLVRWLPYSQRVQAQLEFHAPDPFRYAPPVAVSTGFAQDLSGLRFDLFTDGTDATGSLTFGDPGAETGAVYVTNLGTATAWPQFRVHGPSPDAGVEIVEVETGRRLRYEAGVPAGMSVTIDPAEGVVLLGGADRLTSLRVREWPSVPAGATRSYLFRSLGGHSPAVLDVELASTYW